MTKKMLISLRERWRQRTTDSDDSSGERRSRGKSAVDCLSSAPSSSVKEEKEAGAIRKSARKKKATSGGRVERSYCSISPPLPERRRGRRRL